MKKQILLIYLFACNSLFTVLASTSDTLIYKINIKKEIGSTAWIYTQQGFAEAEKLNATCVLLHLNTYGGEITYADSIRTRILDSSMPVYVFIDHNAASAGALISIACDKIYMRPGATIGAATVVNQNGEQMPDKYQSYMRATMRATAEAQGKDTIINGKDTIFRWRRDPLIAEAMVDKWTVIPNIIDSGKTLTFTTEEAVKYGYCDGIANNVEDLVKHQLNCSNYEIKEYKPSTYDHIIGFLTNSILQSLLIMLIVGGIYFELQTPGVGFPLIAAITAALLYFAPLYIGGLAANWEILLFVIGIVLIILEIFVIPGFGVVGISGIVLVVGGLTLSLLDNVALDFRSVKLVYIGDALLTVIAGLGLGIGIILYLSSKIGTKGLFRKVALNTTMDKQTGYVGVSTQENRLVGQNGIAATVLRPSGKVKIDGQYYDAVSEGKFIEKGQPIVVTRYETGQLYVILQEKS